MKAFQACYIWNLHRVDMTGYEGNWLARPICANFGGLTSSKSRTLRVVGGCAELRLMAIALYV